MFKGKKYYEDYFNRLFRTSGVQLFIKEGDQELSEIDKDCFYELSPKDVKYFSLIKDYDKGKVLQQILTIENIPSEIIELLVTDKILFMTMVIKVSDVCGVNTTFRVKRIEHNKLVLESGYPIEFYVFDGSGSSDKLFDINN